MTQMDTKGPNQVFNSEPIDINNTGYSEEPAKYMANPKKGFWNTIKRIIIGG